MQIKGHFADSDDAAGEAVDAAAAAVPDSAVDETTLHVTQAEVLFVTAVWYLSPWIWNQIILEGKLSC